MVNETTLKRKEYMKEYHKKRKDLEHERYMKNREEKLAYAKQYRLDNLDKIREQNSDPVKNKASNDKRKDYFKKYHKENAEKRHENYLKNKDEKSEYNKQHYLNNTEKYKEKAMTLYNKNKDTEEYKLKHVININRDRKNHPKEYKARAMVHNDKIKNPHKYSNSCSICNSSENVEYHHEDYDKPLEVIPLCREHHRDLHYQIKENK